MEGLHVFVVCLSVYLGYAFAVGGVVAHEAAVVLVAVELKHVHGLRVGTPRNVGEIAVGGVAGLQVDRLVGVHVVHADGHLVRRLARHGVFVGLVFGGAAEDVHLRVVRNHRLVHAVESQMSAVGTPEGAFLYAELVAVHALCIHNLAAAVGRQLCAVALVVGHEEVVVPDEGKRPRLHAELLGLHLVAVVLCEQLFLLPVHEHGFLSVDKLHHGFSGIGEAGVVEVSHAVLLAALRQRYDVIECEEQLFLAGLLVHDVAVSRLRPHQFVAPPCEKPVFGRHAVVVHATVVQVLEREFFLCHGHGRHE